MNKEILKVYLELNEKTGRPVINWEYKESIKAWTMIGVLETIKKELLEHIDFVSEEELDE